VGSPLGLSKPPVTSDEATAKRKPQTRHDHGCALRGWKQAQRPTVPCATIHFVVVTILAVLAVIALFLLGRWIVHRIEDYPATLFGPLDPPPESS
jgi:hypothetical protein